MRYDKALGAFVELAASRHNAIHSTEAAEVHVTAERLRGLELKRVVYRLHPRVWAASALPRSTRQTLRGAALSVSLAAATTTSAAAIHGWLKHPPNPQLWVPDQHTRNHSVATLRRWSRIDPTRDLTVVDSVPTLDKAAALCSLGPHVGPLALEHCLDEYLRHDSLQRLEETMSHLAGRKPGGVRALARILESREPKGGLVESWLERVVANLVARPWLPPLQLQHEVRLPDRRYRLDIACPDLMLGVEAHSRSFHWGRGKEDADNVRDLHLTAAGWQVLYVTHSQTKDPAGFARLFSAAARTRAAQLGVALPSPNN